MEQSVLTLSYMFMVLFQIYHIFEEIAGKAYELAGSLSKYLFVASVLVTLNFAILASLVFDLRAGYILGIVGALISILNGLVHLVGYVKTGCAREGVGAGVFTGIPLAIAGVVVLYQLFGIMLG